MSLSLPVVHRRMLVLENGVAVGVGFRWNRGHACAIYTAAGVLDSGLLDLAAASELGHTAALCCGTPDQPLHEPEDLLAAVVRQVTPAARELGVEPGQTGRLAVERMLKAAAAACGAASSKSPTAPTAATCNVQTIDHVTVVVADMERSRHFYCDILGMRQVERPNFSFPGRWFQAGDTQVHLIEQHEGSSPAGFPAERTKRGGRAMHFAFETPDGQAALEVLRRHGVPLLGEPKHRPDGCLQIFCSDPDGHVVEVFSRPPLA